LNDLSFDQQEIEKNPKFKGKKIKLFVEDSTDLTIIDEENEKISLPIRLF
jgi:hypothetical protein